MSYTPTTWNTGDTITASAMNKIEQGIANAGSVATVMINFNDGGIGGSVFCFVGYAKYNNALDGYSIEGNMGEVGGTVPCARFYTPVCLTDANDDYKPFIFFPEYINEIGLFTITGNISNTKVVGHIKTNSSQWESVPYYGFEVQGDGSISVAYND